MARWSRLSGNAPRIVEYIDVSKTYLDGTAFVGALDGVIRERMKLALNGMVAVAVIVDEDDVPDGRQLGAAAAVCPRRRAMARTLPRWVEDALAEAMPRFDTKTVMDDDRLEEAVRRIVRNLCLTEIGKKPEVAVLISRLMAA